MDVNRQADLHYAFQFGQDFARSGDPAVEAEFRVTFVGDAEAAAEFDRGVEDVRRRAKRLH